MNSRIDFVLEPILRNFLVHYSNIPGVARSEIASASGETKTPLCSAGVEHRIWPTDRPTFAERNYVAGFFHRLRLGLAVGCRGLRNRLPFSILLFDRNRSRFLDYRLRPRFLQSLPFRRQHVLCL